MATDSDTASSTWDVIVIGGRPAGENAAQYATQFSGLRAVMVEAELVGGECSYWACMPSKGLLMPVELLDQVRHVGGVAEVVGSATVDVEAVLARRDSIVHGMDDSSQVDWAQGAGIGVVRGRGRLAGAKTVIVTAADGTETTLTAELRSSSRPGRSGDPPVGRPPGGTAVDLAGRDEHPRDPAPDRHHRRRRGGVRSGDLASRPGRRGADDRAARDGAGGSERAVRERPARVVVRGRRSHRAARTSRGGGGAAEVNDAGYGHVHGGEVSVTLDDETVLVCDEVVAAVGRTAATRTSDWRRSGWTRRRATDTCRWTTI